MKIYSTLVCLLSLLVTGCISTPPESKARNYTPAKFKAYIGGFSGPSYTVEFLPPSTLRYTHASRGAKMEVTDIEFNPEHWESVYIRLEGAGIFQWRSRYVRDGVSDGTQWSLDYEIASQKKKIWGDNRYPDYGEFRDYLQLVSDMAGGKKFE